MKKLLNLILIVLVLAALGWALWSGFTHHHDEDDDDDEKSEAAVASATTEEEKAEPLHVALTAEQAEALGVKFAQPEKAESKPQRLAFGRVLDPTPLVALDGDFAAANAALAASRAEYERTQKLLAGGENTSRKVAETAEAQFRADEIKTDSLRRRALMEWGPELAALEVVERRAFVEKLVRGESALVRVDLFPGDALAEQPKRARLLVLGREEQPIHVASITPAADVDPKAQAQGFILHVDESPFPLRPGMALTAWIELPQEPRAGVAVPRSAVLRHDGRTWVYVLKEDHEFTRKSVVLDTPLEGERGWFVAEEGGVSASDALVVTGAQSLLSEELKAQGGGEPD